MPNKNKVIIYQSASCPTGVRSCEAASLFSGSKLGTCEKELSAMQSPTFTTQIKAIDNTVDHLKLFPTPSVFSCFISLAWIWACPCALARSATARSRSTILSARIVVFPRPGRFWGASCFCQHFLQSFCAYAYARQSITNSITPCRC